MSVFGLMKQIYRLFDMRLLVHNHSNNLISMSKPRYEFELLDDLLEEKLKNIFFDKCKAKAEEMNEPFYYHHDDDLRREFINEKKDELVEKLLSLLNEEKL